MCIMSYLQPHAFLQAQRFFLVYRPMVFSGGATAAMWL